MKKGLILILTLLVVNSLIAQSDSKEIEVGVVEHLGDTIPLALTFLNEDNDTITLKELVNKPTIFNFVYFDCPGLCSPLLAGVSDAVDKLDMDLGKDYQVVTISFNTKDTPEKAKEKKENFVQKINKENRDAWHYLTGSQENIDIITDALGFKYKPAGLDFSHPSVIIIVSPEGKITRYLYGLTYLPFDVKMALIEAQKGISRPSINKILELCFAYDPQSRGYTLQVTTIVGAFILGIAVITFIILLIKGRKKTA